MFVLPNYILSVQAAAFAKFKYCMNSTRGSCNSSELNMDTLKFDPNDGKSFNWRHLGKQEEFVHFLSSAFLFQVQQPTNTFYHLTGVRWLHEAPRRPSQF